MPVPDLVDVAILGAGQAGLAVAHELAAQGVETVVFERARVGQSWRDRWDSFTLVTPNWTLDLPGQPYAGDDPEGHVRRDEIVDYLQRYADRLPFAVCEGVTVRGLCPTGEEDRYRYRLSLTDGDLLARTVVVCTGSFGVPHSPVEFGSTGVLALDATAYRSPGELPPGPVLVVGSGQTGCQLAEELHLSGREVVLSCGRAPWLARRIAGLDIVTWLSRTPFFDMPLAALSSPVARLGANPQTTGARGGHDLHYRTLQALGVRLVGRVAQTDRSRVRFADDLADSVAFGDARAAEVRELLRGAPGIPLDAPELADPPPFHADSVPELDVSGFAAVITTSGFRPDYARWVDLPVFDQLGFPVTDGDCAAAPGLYFCGVHFLQRRSSSLMFGVGRDATTVATAIAHRR